MEKKYNLAVVVGRFEPVHLMHEHLFAEAHRLADEVLVLVGSAHRARDIKNPFTYAERAHMISMASVNTKVEPLVDYLYDDDKWVSQVQAIASRYVASGDKVVLVGHKKDDSSYYLKLFPHWDYFDVAPSRLLDSTDIRGMMLRPDFKQSEWCQVWVKQRVSEPVFKFLMDFTDSNEYHSLISERIMIDNYAKSWANAPYKPTFVTCDAVVTCAGHVLMVRRKFAPGQGLLALPGGFLNQNERVVDGIIRELKEETRIDLVPAVLKGNMRQPEVFDHPNRSLRGRTITHAAHIPLSFANLPNVKGDDDAEVAIWVPYNDLKMNRDQVFEDHVDVISKLTGLDL